jgi:alkanesulfonate monooxygenase SsuD/methylene tetrahydromethanopterin reductase-like flavin-dependent oxidoreductase (luciferase family)
MTLAAGPCLVRGGSRGYVQPTRFGIIDHSDDTGRPHVRQVAERLELIEAYDRLSFYAYHLTEHHGTPLAVTPSPHLMLAAAAQRTSRLRLGRSSRSCRCTTRCASSRRR